MQIQSPKAAPSRSPAPPAAPAARRWVPIRTLGPRHRGSIRDHLLGLAAADRQLRFGHAASDDVIRRYVEQIDFGRDEVFGVFDRRLRLVGMAHLAFVSAGGPAEFGVSVSAQQRGRGVGAQLFDRAVMHARNRGVRTMVIQLARDNLAMLAIVRRAGASLSFDGGAEVQAELPLPANTLVSQIEALIGQQTAELDYRMKLQVLRLDALQ